MMAPTMMKLDATIRLDHASASRSNTDRSLETHARSRRSRIEIGRDLRLMYAGLLREPLPDRLLDLIARLGLTARRTLQ